VYIVRASSSEAVVRGCSLPFLAIPRRPMTDDVDRKLSKKEDSTIPTSCQDYNSPRFWDDMSSAILTNASNVVNLKRNPESNTGYNGTQVWDAIYRENCFSRLGGDGKSALVSPSLSLTSGGGVVSLCEPLVALHCRVARCAVCRPVAVSSCFLSIASTLPRHCAVVPLCRSGRGRHVLRGEGAVSAAVGHAHSH
jgi:hypothetical protein